MADYTPSEQMNPELYPTVEEWVTSQLDTLMSAVPDSSWTELRTLLNVPASPEAA